MNKEEIPKYKLFKSLQNKELYHFFIIPVLMILTYLLVYTTDDKVFSHAMYIPVVYAAFSLGMNYSLATALIGGILLGPLMPLSVATGEAQEFIEWVYRLVMFIGVGLLSGIAVNILKKNSATIVSLFSLNQSTNIPNQNGLKLIRANTEQTLPQTIVSIIINNYDVLLDLFGSFLYNKMVVEVFKNLKTEFDDSTIIQPDDYKLWLIIKQDNLDKILERVNHSLNQKIVVDDVLFYVDFVLGLNSITSLEEAAYDQAFLDADAAARHAQSNSLVHAIYDGKKSFKHHEFELLGSFNKSLDQKQLYLVYQPIIDLKTNKITKFEALTRWNHPVRGLIPPDEFIHLLEQTQLIHQLTLWVTQTVIEKILEFRAHNIEMIISINISAKNLYNKQYVSTLIDLTDKAGIDPKAIELEITETQLLVGNDESNDSIARLKEHGFQITIDDFGKGYSSLSYLHLFPFSTIKIDHYYAKQLKSDPTAKKIIQATTSFAHHLGLKVVCEGIENEQIDTIIREIKPDYGQGYYYARPIKDNEVLDFYINNKGIVNIN